MKTSIIVSLVLFSTSSFAGIDSPLKSDYVDFSKINLNKYVENRPEIVVEKIQSQEDTKVTAYFVFEKKINDIDKQILNYKIAKEEAQIKIKNNFGHPLVSVWINTVETNDIFTARLEHEKESLKIELNRRLVELGEF